jgi:AraC-like DNA-binding protein
MREISGLTCSDGDVFTSPHLQVSVLAAAYGATVREVRCRSGSSGFEAAEPAGDAQLVFVRRGAFWRRANGVEHLLDPGSAYFTRPGCEQEFSHPNHGEDVCHVVTLSPDLLAATPGLERHLPDRPIRVDATVLRSLRHLLIEAVGRRQGDWLDRAIHLFGDVLHATELPPGSMRERRPRAHHVHRRIAEHAREALCADSTLTLVALSRLVGSSPHHLSRIFHSQTGATLSAYRRRLRVSEAMERIAAGEASLSRLAAELGFSDHSHLTRSIVREVGETPTALREAAGRCGTGLAYALRSDPLRGRAGSARGGG